MTAAEIVAAYLDRSMPYAEAYQRLAFAGVRDPGRVLAGQTEQGWAAVFVDNRRNPWTT